MTDYLSDAAITAKFGIPEPMHLVGLPDDGTFLGKVWARMSPFWPGHADRLAKCQKDAGLRIGAKVEAAIARYQAETYGAYARAMRETDAAYEILARDFFYKADMPYLDFPHSPLKTK